ncbi:MAG: cation-binding protein [Sulfolobaceae archaeon]
MIKDPITLLKFEHSVFKIRFGIILSLLNKCEDEAFKFFEETHSFIVRWHAVIEDKFIFPAYGEKAMPLSNDHKLIEKYGNNIIQQRKKEWVERYINIVLDHNKNEETMLFTEEKDIYDSWRRIIEYYKNYPEYSRITGIELT